MENNKAMTTNLNLTTATKLDLLLAEVQGEVTVKRLKTRGPRKGETLQTGIGGGRVVTGTPVSGTSVKTTAACNGGWAVGTGQVGQGAKMVDNLSKVKRTYAAQAKADRRAATLDRLAERV